MVNQESPILVDTHVHQLSFFYRGGGVKAAGGISVLQSEISISAEKFFEDRNFGREIGVFLGTTNACCADRKDTFRRKAKQIGPSIGLECPVHAYSMQEKALNAPGGQLFPESSDLKSRDMFCTTIPLYCMSPSSVSNK